MLTPRGRRSRSNSINIPAAGAARQTSVGTERATSVNTPLLRLQSSEGNFTRSREIEPVRRSLCRHRSRRFTEVARLVPSGKAKPLRASQSFSEILPCTGFKALSPKGESREL